jgi:hypothetical protein
MRAVHSDYFRKMARELAVMADVSGYPVLAHLFRMADEEARRIGAKEEAQRRPWSPGNP